MTHLGKSKRELRALLTVRNLIQSVHMFSKRQLPIIVFVVGGNKIPTNLWPPDEFPNLVVLYMHPYFRIPHI